MNYKRLAICTLAAFALLFGIDFVVHGILLEGLYAETSTLWRPKDEMMAMMPIMTASQFVLAFLLSVAYALLMEDRGWKTGLRFGWIFGVILGFMAASSYAYMPISVFLGSVLIN